MTTTISITGASAGFGLMLANKLHQQRFAVIGTRPIGTKQPRFSNPVGKMTGMILFQQSFAPKIFEDSILNSVEAA